MKILTEKGAESFLSDQGFDVLEGIYLKDKKDLENNLEKILFPCVMKVSGKKIIHKHGIKGVIVGIVNKVQVKKSFEKLIKIKNAEEVFVQEQVSGKEFLLGIKKTPEFGHVVCFGAGGTNTEILKDVSFRLCPLDLEEIRSMIKETKISKGLLKLRGEEIERALMKLCLLSRKFPNIKELDINPLINGKIVDARIVFEN
jgi:hypothetical protein